MARILAVAIILLSLNGVHADLLNGSFENDGAGWESRWLRGPLTGASAVFDTALAQDGRKSLKVIIPEAGARYRLMQSIPVDPRRAYRVTFSYYTAATQGSSASFRIGPSDAQNQHLGYFGGRDLAPTGHVWIDYEIDFLPPAQARTAAIEFNFIGPIDARLDNVRCEPVSPGREKQLRDLLDIPHPLFESLIVPNSKPDRPRLFPYWSYSPDKAHFTGMALRYGHEYCLPEEFRDCRDRRLAPLFSHWHQRFPDLAKQYDPPVTYYLMSHQDIVARAVAAGAVPCRGQHPNPNDPALVQTFVETIRADNDIPRAVDAGRECFYFIYDEMFVGSCQAPDMNARTGPYWKNADAIVKKSTDSESSACPITPPIPILSAGSPTSAGRRTRASIPSPHWPRSFGKRPPKPLSSVPMSSPCCAPWTGSASDGSSISPPAKPSARPAGSGSTTSATWSSCTVT